MQSSWGTRVARRFSPAGSTPGPHTVPGHEPRQTTTRAAVGMVAQKHTCTGSRSSTLSKSTSSRFRKAFMSAGLESVSVEPTTVIDLSLIAAVNSMVMISCTCQPYTVSCSNRPSGATATLYPQRQKPRRANRSSRTCSSASLSRNGSSSSLWHQPLPSTLFAAPAVLSFRQVTLSLTCSGHRAQVVGPCDALRT